MTWNTGIETTNFISSTNLEIWGAGLRNAEEEEEEETPDVNLQNEITWCFKPLYAL